MARCGVRSRDPVLIGAIAALAPLAIAHAQNSYYWSFAGRVVFPAQ
jgi:hypothetical protein